MKKKLLSLLILAAGAVSAQGQVVSAASFMQARAKSDAVVPFRYGGQGVPTPIEWGLDLAWLSEANLRTGVLFAGRDLIDVVRVSYRPTESVAGGALSESQLSYVKQRADLVKAWCKPSVKLNLNSDHESVDSWYNAFSIGSTGRGQRWAKVIDLHYDAYRAQGLTNFMSISPYNEPDYGWDQGYSANTRKADFLATAKSLREDYGGKYDGVRLCGGNTLNDDKAYEWWNYLKAYLDEGNTHQLAGSFDNYADFFTQVRAYGHHATADELHNTMEAMVGVEYGMQTGIWWGTAEYTRSQFMKATRPDRPGQRLGYAEHRANWTAASVYRHADGTVQAFGGTSERQAATTAYRFVSLDRPVWYNGERGRDFRLALPGGTGYQQGQTNAETLVDIQGGADVMPAVGGTYKVVNVASGLPMGFSSNPTGGWTSVALRRNSNTYKYMQWVVNPVAQEGDYAYYTFLLNTGKGMYLDILDWNYEAGADVGAYAGGLGTNEQWYLQYAGGGAFYIRSRYSAKCLAVKDGRTAAGTNVQMEDYTGDASQQWRFLPANVTPDLVAPAAPTALTATPQAASIALTWEPSPSTDVQEYALVRNGYLLARGLKATTFTDNETEPDSIYSYAVYAIDKSLNYSTWSNITPAVSPTDERAEVVRLPLNGNTLDATPNGNHAAPYGTPAYVTEGDHPALALMGEETFLQLPYTIANHDELTVSCWVRYRGGDPWQRIFDFGNGTDHYLFLTPNSGSGPRFAIKNGGEEFQVNAGMRLTTNAWHHLTVTLGGGTASLYVDGQLKGTNPNVSVKPSDIRPVINHIGLSQFTADPFLNADVADFTLQNRALTAEEVAQLVTAVEGVKAVEATDGPLYDLSGRPASPQGKGIRIRQGKKQLR